MTASREQLLIVGASVRAAAFSAIRAGFLPLAADKFADTDVTACCPARRVVDYPRGLPAVVSDWPPCGWMYTGALENRPAVVDRLAARRPLDGNPGAVLRRIRDPFRLVEALRDGGFPHLEVARTRPLAAGVWLRKPRDSCGGSRITVVADADRDAAESAGPRAPRRRVYFQRYQPGLSGSSVYVANGRRAALLGATRQLIGTDWLGARGFQYAGSVGPLPLAAGMEQDLTAVGEHLAQRFGLRGLFGVDWILADGRIWPVEVNPRYTASIEVLERACALCAVEWHVQACRTGVLPAPLPVAPSCYAGKAILYARRNTLIPTGFADHVRATNDASPGQPTLADVPAAGTRIPSGQPILSVLVESPALDQIEDQLRAQVAAVEARLARNPTTGVCGITDTGVAGPQPDFGVR